MRYLWLAALCLGLTLPGVWPSADGGTVAAARGITRQDSDLPQDNPVAMSEASVAGGRRVYGRFCASCHGRSGQGDGLSGSGDVPPANLVDDAWDHGDTDADIFRTIAQGVPPDYNMDEWRGRITDEDIWNIINYLRDLAASE